MIKRIADQWAQRLSPWTPVVLRVVVGIIFAVHGWQKFSNMDGTIGFFSMIGIPAATFSAYLVSIVELVGGIALIAGLWTRVAAKLLGIVMLVATLITISKGFNMFELPLVLLAACFTLFCIGGGKYSMDR